jgi:integrase
MPKLSKITFSDLTVRKMKSVGERQDFFDAVTRGLGVRVSKSATKTWFFMRRVNGRMTRTKIGRYPDMCLSEAREEAVKLASKLSKGLSIKRARASKLEDVFELWMQEDQARKRAAPEVRRALQKDLISRLGSLPVDQVQEEQVYAILRDIQRRGAPIHANRVLSYAKRLFNWCQEQRLVVASPIGNIRKPSKEKSRERYLTRSELQKVWRGSERLGYPFGPFVQLLILTGQRRSEVAGITWSEIDLEAGTWTQPSSKTKNGRSHVVFLCRRAKELLQGIRHWGVAGTVFSTKSGKPISGFSKAKRRLDKISGVTNWTFHDIRRTFATHATECLDTSPAVIEKVLNHSSGAVTGIARVYQRAEYRAQRRFLAERWADLVEQWILEPNSFDSALDAIQPLDGKVLLIQEA